MVCEHSTGGIPLFYSILPIDTQTVYYNLQEGVLILLLSSPVE